MIELNELGIGQLFGPGTPVQDTINYIENEIASYRKFKDE